jgi:hypothetical protein
MSPPKETLVHKSRAQLWKETLMGGTLFIFGLVLIWQYTLHVGHDDHALGSSILYVGVGSVSVGLWMTNKKLTKEWLMEVREFTPFAHKSKNDE